MASFVWILLLCAVPAVLSVPWDEPEEDIKWIVKAKLDDTIRKLKVSTESCRQLSETFGMLAKNLVKIPNSLFVDISPEITEDEMERIFEMVFGFDIVNDHKAREKFTCQITRAQTLPELIQILEDEDLLYNVFRILYDIDTVWVRVLKQRTSDTRVIAFIDALESAGMLNLDQGRTEWLTNVGNLKSIWPWIDEESVPKMPVATDTRCSHVTDKFTELIRDILPYHPRCQMLYSLLHEITGLNVMDRDMVENFFCELVYGAESGVRGLYEVWKTRGYITDLLETGYAYLQMYEPIWRQQLEIMLHRNTIKPLSWGIFVSKYWPKYPRTYPIRSHDLDMLERMRMRQGLRYDVTVPRDPKSLKLAEVTRMVVEFLRKLETSNLLKF